MVEELSLKPSGGAYGKGTKLLSICISRTSVRSMWLGLNVYVLRLKI